MKINFNKRLAGFDNKDVEVKSDDKDEIEDKNKKPEYLLIKDVVVNILSANYKDDIKTKPEEKLTRFELAIKIKNADSAVELTVEEATLIKKLAAKGGTILAYGRICELIEDGE